MYQFWHRVRKHLILVEVNRDPHKFSRSDILSIFTTYPGLLFRQPSAVVCVENGGWPEKVARIHWQAVADQVTAFIEAGLQGSSESPPDPYQHQAQAYTRGSQHYPGIISILFEQLVAGMTGFHILDHPGY